VVVIAIFVIKLLIVLVFVLVFESVLMLVVVIAIKKDLINLKLSVYTGCDIKRRM